MKDGEVVEAGLVSDVFDAPRHPYTQMLLAAQPRGCPLPLRPGAPTLMQGTGVQVHFPIRRGVLRRTVAHVKAVDGVDVVVHEGETVGLVGESGSGKSTMGYALLRLVAAQGCIRFDGTDLADLDKKTLRKLRADMQIVFQDPFGSLSPRLTVAEIVAEGLAVHEPSLTRRQRGDRVAEALMEVGLAADIGDRYPHEFSGGQRQRIAIARAMVLKPRFVVLDEPTSALDMSVQAQIVDLLQQLQRDHQLGYLFISHDLRVVRALAHRIVVLRHGLVVEQGPANEVLARPRHEYTRALMAAAFTLDTDESVVEDD
jgi:microcin C transport system ATP-binding protein